ncbi:flagellar assembly protein FliW [Petrotoga sp. HKA.pet.4.5]|uniref:flagellar assembly protein FliW n=1 Tax=unclassified Petrotoga TaxID=2620614 RepID=UPI000EF1420C|nr:MULTISPECIES: flagellar assembly protein FliW [unclassified Petrotoga]RLL83873.1 flagellar assembly protein FliW [Petrotoga sp. Shatin.DS.tank11.9.2.9.3]RLL90234.1 flagellar assembly protein FliW [Petrotoga sp. HKA.pet.4.5]
MIKEYETKLGSVKIETEKTIIFEYGIPGFEDLKQFVLLEPEDTYPIMWLASLEDKKVAFPVTFPQLIRNDYQFALPQDLTEYLELEKPEDAIILSILTIPEKEDEITINLAAPIIISQKNHKGVQYLIENEEYKIRHFLKEELERSKAILSVQKDGE